MVKEYATIRKETKLLLDNPETDRVDFKESFSGVEKEDLVAFANAKGGSILVGVKEYTHAGMQRGKIVGWTGDFDKERNQIQNKAHNCIPPINLAITIENKRSKKLIRIDVEEAEEKPCCTQGGRYLIRRDGVNRGIQPPELVAMILEREASQFTLRLETAGKEFMENLLDGLKQVMGLIENLQATADQIEVTAAEARDASFDAAYDR